MQELIVNGVELNPAYPLKEQLVLADPARVQNWINSFSAAKVLCVVSEAGQMRDAMERLGYQTQVIASSSGLLCQEESAIWKALAGEKAYPCYVSPEQREKYPPVVNLLELIPPEEIGRAIYQDQPELCIIQNLLNLVNRLLEQSCGKCVFCREGLGQMQSILQGIASGSGKAEDLQALYELADLLAVQVLCGFGAAAAREILTRMKQGEEDLLAHIEKGHCEQAVCPGLVFYKILGGKCMGCGECLDVCPEDAISGKKRMIHVIQEKDCTNCGACAEACKNGAIVRCSALNKPLCPPRPIPVGAWKK